MGNRTRWYQTLGMDTRHKARACAYLSAAEIEHTGSAWCSRTVHAISVLKNLTVPCTLPYSVTGGRGPHTKNHTFSLSAYHPCHIKKQKCQPYILPLQVKHDISLFDLWQSCARLVMKSFKL